MELFSNQKILFKNEENKIKTHQLIKKLKLHNLLKLNFLNQFMIYIFSPDDENLIIRLYKGKYELNSKFWNFEELYLLTSIKINFGEIDNDIYDVENIENIDYIEKNDITLDNIDFVIYYPYNVKDSEISFYNFQQLNYIDIDEEFEEKTLYSNWGFDCNYKDIKWMINIESLINSNYGIGDDKLYYIRSKDFIKMKFSEIYYKHIDLDSILYQKIIESVSFVCDCCGDYFQNLENTKLWHNDLFGDLCEICYSNKKKKEKYRKNIIKNKILLIGKRKLFEKELIKTKLYLAKNKVNDLSVENKNKICKKILHQTLNTLNKQYYKCSICLDNMEYDIYSGSCGHCFHKDCIFSIHNEECPLCRIHTNFYKIYLDN